MEREVDHEATFLQPASALVSLLVWHVPPRLSYLRPPSPSPLALTLTPTLTLTLIPALTLALTLTPKCLTLTLQPAVPCRQRAELRPRHARAHDCRLRE